jgi:CysZ protein
MTPLLLAFGQLDDPACFGVLVRSVVLALIAYLALLAASIWGIHGLLSAVHWPAWLAGIIGTVGVVLLAMWLFLPTVLLIAMLYIERIARAVDRRFYPYLPPPSPAALPVQLWDGLAIAARVLLLNLVSLVLAFLPVPGVGLALALLVSGWAIGRGLFVAVAMRRMGRPAAQALYRRHRFAVLVPGMLLALAALVPGLNVLVPILGTAAMVHVLNRSNL